MELYSSLITVSSNGLWSMNGLWGQSGGDKPETSMTSMVALMIFIAHSLAAYSCAGSQLHCKQPSIEGKPCQLWLLIAAMGSTGCNQGQVHLC